MIGYFFLGFLAPAVFLGAGFFAPPFLHAIVFSSLLMMVIGFQSIRLKDSSWRR